jgi:hypothetical protein
MKNKGLLLLITEKSPLIYPKMSSILHLTGKPPLILLLLVIQLRHLLGKEGK